MQTINPPSFSAPLAQTLKQACRAVAPEGDELDRAERTGRADDKQRKDLLGRKQCAVKAALRIASEDLKLPDDYTKPAAAWLARPTVENAKAAARVLEESPLTRDHGSEGNPVTRPNYGNNEAAKGAYYLLMAVTAPYASSAASYLYDVAMCAARAIESSSKDLEGGSAHRYLIGKLGG